MLAHNSHGFSKMIKGKEYIYIVLNYENKIKCLFII